MRGGGLFGVLGGIVIGDIGVDSAGNRNGECCYLGDVDGCRGVGGGIIVAGCIAEWVRGSESCCPVFGSVALIVRILRGKVCRIS